MKLLDKRTKIVATLGPASNTPETLEALIAAGVNVFRLNFSHSDPRPRRSPWSMVRAARDKLGMPIAIMADIKGPAVRMYGYAAALPIESGTFSGSSPGPPRGSRR